MTSDAIQPTLGSQGNASLLCDLQLEREYELVPCIICAMCGIFGIIYCFFGYRCFKVVMFLSGLMFGSTVVFLLCYKERLLEAQLSVAASAGIGLAVGVLCGLVTMLVRSLGLFMVGLALGLLLAAGGLLAAGPLYQPRSVWVPLGLLLGAGLLGAVLTLQWQKLFTVLSTAVLGAAILVLAADYLLQASLLGLYVYPLLKASAPPPPACWHSWLLLGAWPSLAALGVLLQWKLTADGYSHTEVIISNRQKRVQLMRIRQKAAKKRQRTAPQDTYRRKPYPIKRYTGDILSPSYIQSIRDRQTGTSLSSLHMAPPGATELDYDCGSTVPLTATPTVITV
ncbi:transmembrane protein 198-like [Callorhinchus milii]|nr:transmembrane protein 198-like [Callorhinchus milii]XP_042200306.1 transmembrane protein 198-like [Callorhinchus milii]